MVGEGFVLPSVEYAGVLEDNGGHSGLPNSKGVYLRVFVRAEMSRGVKERTRAT